MATHLGESASVGWGGVGGGAEYGVIKRGDSFDFSKTVVKPVSFPYSIR